MAYIFAMWFVLAIRFKLLTILKFVCTVTNIWHRERPTFKPWRVWFYCWL